jgi:Tol biopolymer transport system component
MKQVKMAGCILAGILAFSGFSSGAQEEPLPVIFSEGQWSPDGNFIVFTGNIDGQTNLDVGLLDLRTMELRNLTDDNEFTDFLPRWSPDGEAIVYVAQQLDDPSAYDVMVRELSSDAPLNLTESNPDYDGNPIWSPDGNQIAYRGTLYEDSIYANVFVVGRGGGDPVNVSMDEPGLHELVGWTDAGHVLWGMFHDGDGVQGNFSPMMTPQAYWLADVAAGTRRIVSTPEMLAARTLKLSSVGDRLFAAEGNRISVLTVGDTSEVVFTAQVGSENALVGYSPGWSADGGKIVLNTIDGYKNYLWSINADGSNLTDVTPEMDGQHMEPIWSPDGTQILFTSGTDGNFDLWMMNTDGSNPVNLTEGFR